MQIDEVEPKQVRRLEDKGGKTEDETVRIKEEGREKESWGCEWGGWEEMVS